MNKFLVKEKSLRKIFAGANNFSEEFDPRFVFRDARKNKRHVPARLTTRVSVNKIAQTRDTPPKGGGSKKRCFLNIFRGSEYVLEIGLDVASN